MSSDKLFHSFGPVTVNALLPYPFAVQSLLNSFWMILDTLIFRECNPLEVMKDILVSCYGGICKQEEQFF